MTTSCSLALLTYDFLSTSPAHTHFPLAPPTPAPHARQMGAASGRTRWPRLRRVA